MWKDRNGLEKTINFALNDINKNGIVQDILKNNMIDSYINKAIISKALCFDLPLNYLSKSELQHVAFIINKYCENKIDVDEYYLAADNIDFKLNYNSIIELKNVLYCKNVNEESWATIVTYKDLSDMMKTGKLVYNVDIQMQGSLCKNDDKAIIIPYIDEKNIEEKKEAMLMKKYPANMIVFNVYNVNNDKLLFNSNNGILRIDTDIFNVAIIDGIHRISAAMRAIEENNDLYGELILKITNTSIKEFQNFIRQEAMGKNARDVLKKFNPNNKITTIIKDINEMGSKLKNVLYRRIDFKVNTPEAWILFENFEEGLVWSGFMDDINNAKTEIQLEKIKKFIVRFFNVFYKVVKNNKVNKNRKDIYTDPTFIIGILITCHRYYKANNIDIKLMNEAAKKIKYTSTKFTFDYPINSRREKLLIYNRFYRLFEKFEVVEPKNNYIKSKDNQMLINKSGDEYYSLKRNSYENNNIDYNIKNIILNVNSIENLDTTITVYENNISNKKTSNKRKRNNNSILDADNEKGLTNLEIYQLGISGELFVYRLLFNKNEELINGLGLKNVDIDIDWYNKSYSINDENWEDQSMYKGHDIKINADGKSIYLEIKTSIENINYYTLTKNESEKNIKAQDDYYVIKINNMKYYNSTLHKPDIRIIKNPLKMAGIYLCKVNNLRDISIYL